MSFLCHTWYAPWSKDQGHDLYCIHILFYTLKPHTTELNIYTISLLVLSELPIHSSNVCCPGGFTLLTELGSTASVVTFSLWHFWRNYFSSPNCQCVSSLWHGRLSRSWELQLLVTFSDFLFTHFLQRKQIDEKENWLIKDRRQTHGFSPSHIMSWDLKIESGNHEGRNSDFYDNGWSGFLLGYHLQWGSR